MNKRVADPLSTPNLEEPAHSGTSGPSYITCTPMYGWAW